MAVEGLLNEPQIGGCEPGAGRDPANVRDPS